MLFQARQTFVHLQHTNIDISDSNVMNTSNVQEESKDIVKIVHWTPVVQLSFYEARILFVRKNKRITLFNIFGWTKTFKECFLNSLKRSYGSPCLLNLWQVRSKQTFHTYCIHGNCFFWPRGSNSHLKVWNGVTVFSASQYHYFNSQNLLGLTFIFHIQ